MTEGRSERIPFEDVIRAQKNRVRQRNAQRPRGFEIDVQPRVFGLFDGQVQREAAQKIGVERIETGTR
jgi:hypothetical protein